MKLKEEVRIALRRNKRAKRALEDVHDKSLSTIERWIRYNDPMLCNLASLRVIGAYLKKDIEEMIVAEEIELSPVI